MTSCRHCGGEIVACAEPIRYCKGWKHVAFLHYGPVGPHYCEGRSVNPMAEPDGRDRADLIDRIMDAELPRFAEALKRLGEWPAEILEEDEAGCE